MKPLHAQDPFRVGLVAIALAAVGGLVIVGLSVFSPGTRGYTAMLEHSAGLRPGEEVEVHGVPVGLVKAVELAGDEVRVRFQMDKSIRLGDRSTAEVKVATLLGTHYLAVEPLGSGSVDSIPRARTTVPFNLQDVMERGTGSLQKLDPELLAKALTEASRALGSAAPDLKPALTGIARVSDAVAARDGQIQDLLTAARSITDQLSQGSADIVDLLRQSNTVLAEINRRRAAIHTLLVETTKLADGLGGIVSDTQGDLGPALGKLNQVLNVLRSQDASLKTTFDEMAPTVRYLTNATGNGPWGDLWLKSPALPPDDLNCKLQGGC